MMNSFLQILRTTVLISPSVPPLPGPEWQVGRDGAQWEVLRLTEMTCEVLNHISGIIRLGWTAEKRENCRGDPRG